VHHVDSDGLTVDADRAGGSPLSMITSAPPDELCAVAGPRNIRLRRLADGPKVLRNHFGTKSLVSQGMSPSIGLHCKVSDLDDDVRDDLRQRDAVAVGAEPVG
jgi:hypothetical protein